MTFYLPYPDFYRSAKCLTDNHLMEQRNFCRNAIQTLTIPGRCIRQPVDVVMWEGHINALLHLCEATLRERKRRSTGEKGVTPWMLLKKDEERNPLFIGDKEFHDVFKRRLLQAAPAHYGKMGWFSGT
jgi:hypothetical protein